MSRSDQVTAPRRWTTLLWWATLLGYAGGLLWVTLRPAGHVHGSPRPVNLTDVDPLGDLLHGMAPEGDRIHLFVGNLLLLAPLGILLALRRRGPGPWTSVLILVGTTVAIESAQYLSWSYRSADVNDVLVNSVGGIVVFLVVRTLRARVGERPDRRVPKGR